MSHALCVIFASFAFAVTTNHNHPDGAGVSVPPKDNTTDNELILRHCFHIKEDESSCRFLQCLVVSCKVKRVGIVRSERQKHKVLRRRADAPPVSNDMSDHSRIVSFDRIDFSLLSLQLATVSQYPTLNPDHLQPENRLPVVLEKLESEINQHPTNTVVCLQEVSYDWAGAFHTFFSKKGFHLVTGQYGKKFNGYMGVALAWPASTFETVDVDICRLADTREEGWPEREETSFVASIVHGVSSIIDGTMKKLGFQDDKKVPPDHWSLSERRYNVLLTATLREKASGSTFAIGNYHMPCAYYCPMAMTLHSDLCARRVQLIAEKHQVPYLLA